MELLATACRLSKPRPPHSECIQGGNHKICINFRLNPHPSVRRRWQTGDATGRAVCRPKCPGREWFCLTIVQFAGSFRLCTPRAETLLSEHNELSQSRIGYLTTPRRVSPIYSFCVKRKIVPGSLTLLREKGGTGRVPNPRDLAFHHVSSRHPDSPVIMLVFCPQQIDIYRLNMTA